MSFSSRSDWILRVLGRGFIFVLWTVRRRLQFLKLIWLLLQSQNFRLVQPQEWRERWRQCLTSKIIFSSSHFHQYHLYHKLAWKTFSSIAMAEVKRNHRSKRAVEKHYSPEVTRSWEPGVWILHVLLSGRSLCYFSLHLNQGEWERKQYGSFPQNSCF